MTLYLCNRFLLNFVDTKYHLFYLNHSIGVITPLLQMAKNASLFAAAGKQNKIKIKGKSKFPPGIVKFQVLGSGAEGAPRCLYLFTDHSR